MINTLFSSMWKGFVDSMENIDFSVNAKNIKEFHLQNKHHINIFKNSESFVFPIFKNKTAYNYAIFNVFGLNMSKIGTSVCPKCGSSFILIIKNNINAIDLKSNDTLKEYFYLPKIEWINDKEDEFAFINFLTTQFPISIDPVTDK